MHAEDPKSRPLAPDMTLVLLDEARQHFEAARPVAASEDERLETQHYGQTLTGRLARVAALRSVLESAS